MLAQMNNFALFQIKTASLGYRFTRKYSCMGQPKHSDNRKGSTTIVLHISMFSNNTRILASGSNT